MLSEGAIVKIRLRAGREARNRGESGEEGGGDRGESGDRARERGRQRIGVVALTLGFGIVGGWGEETRSSIYRRFPGGGEAAASNVGSGRGRRRRGNRGGGGAVPKASGGRERRRTMERRLVVAVAHSG
jgi:hypothetical protein